MQGAGCRVQGAGCRVQGAGFRVQGAGCRHLLELDDVWVSKLPERLDLRFAFGVRGLRLAVEHFRVSGRGLHSLLFFFIVLEPKVEWYKIL